MAAISKEVSAKVSSMLKDQGMINNQTFQQAMNSEGTSGNILKFLIEKNHVKEDDVLKITSTTYKIPSTEFDPSSVPENVLKKIPLKIIKKYEVIPFKIDDEILSVASADPMKIAMLGPRLRQFNTKGIKLFIAKPSVIDEALDSRSLDDSISETKPEEKTNGSVPKEEEGTEEAPEKLSVKATKGAVEFVDHLLSHALSLDTSDIHIEPFRDGVSRIRFRVNGVLKIMNSYTKFLRDNYGAIVTRLKVMANCNIQEKRLPQDGVLQFKDINNPRGDWIDVRFSACPAKYGERLVMRILKGSPELALDKIGFDENDYKKVLDAMNAPQGMVLVTGPTGSGKSTTLYAALQKINNPKKSILTAEDPVEYYLEGLGQVQANESIGLTFSAILRSFLRQDPEVILVGEIRDKETVDISIKAALTGHLLLSTLHTNDAIATVVRLLNMGVPNFMVSSALTLIVAQRLARRICKSCKIPDDQVNTSHLLDVGFDKEDIPKVTAFRGAGCNNCGGSGYKGRQGIYEVLQNTPKLASGILNNLQAPELLEIAKKDGFLTMPETGRKFIMEGIISVEEFQRVLTS